MCRGEVLQREPPRLGGTLHDVTARKHREEELRRQVQVFENLWDGVVVLDVDGRITDWNASAERMFGFATSDVVSRPMAEALGAQEPVALTHGIRQAIERSARWQSEVRFKKRDGTECDCEALVVPLVDAENRPLGCIAVLRDISERKQLQARLVLADRLSSLGTLAAGVAHEINNPLAFISANLLYVSEEAQRLERELPPGRLKELNQALKETTQGAERIANIVRDLRVFSHGDMDAPVKSVDVQAAVEFTLKMVDGQIRHRARLIKNLGSGLFVRTSETRLGQVLLNLVINAAQAIPEDGDPNAHSITITTRSESSNGDFVIIEVRDTGQGIPPEALSRIFDPFYTTKPVGSGTGLGLSVSHGLVTSMGGRLTVESEPGKGASFRVYLPAVAGEVTREVMQSAKALSPRGRAKILVVDDEPLVGVSVQRLLAREHDVRYVSSAKDARKELTTTGAWFDLVLCDVMMPEITGLELYEELLEKVPALASRVVFMTGGAFMPKTQERLIGMENRKIAKPLDPSSLRALLNEHLDDLAKGSPS
jgi:PAS domain S-box-containing protein